MLLVSAQFWAGGAMRRVRTTIVHGQMDTIANAVRERRHIQFAHFVLDPSSIGITLWLGYLDLAHHLRCRGLLFLQAIGIVFGLETAQIDLDILFRHRQAFVSEKLFDGVNIDSLLDHVGCNRMPELMRCY